MNFVHNLRIRKVADLLRQTGGPSVERVAHQVGFKSRSHFSSAFKNQFGIFFAAFREGQLIWQDYVQRDHS